MTDENTDTEYVVYDRSGKEMERFDSAAEAESERIRLGKRHPGAAFEIEEEEVEDDSEDSMSYGFIQDDEDDKEEQTTLNQAWDWDHGTHKSDSDDAVTADLKRAVEDTMMELDEEVDDEMMAVLNDAHDLVSSTEVTQFECSHEDCGLGHSHPDWKHDIRASDDSADIRSMIPGFNIRPDFAEQMEFSPYCHCGANEAAMLVQFFPYINQQMFKDEEAFEGVMEVRPDILNQMYNYYSTEEMSVSQAAGAVASDMRVDESREIPLGVRENIEAFFERREQMEEQANKAPIAQETRAVIEANRRDLEEITTE